MSRAVAPSNVEDLQSSLQDMVKQLAFTRLIAAVVALVTRLRDLNTELTKQLAHLRRARPRSERLRTIEGQLLLPWTVAASSIQQTSPSGNGAGEKDSPAAPSVAEPSASTRKKPGKRREPDQERFPAAVERVPQYNRVPGELRRCPKWVSRWPASVIPTASTSTAAKSASASVPASTASAAQRARRRARHPGSDLAPDQRWKTWRQSSKRIELAEGHPLSTETAKNSATGWDSCDNARIERVHSRRLGARR